MVLLTSKQKVIDTEQRCGLPAWASGRFCLLSVSSQSRPAVSFPNLAKQVLSIVRILGHAVGKRAPTPPSPGPAPVSAAFSRRTGSLLST